MSVVLSGQHGAGCRQKRLLQRSLLGGRLGGGWKAPSNHHNSPHPPNRHSRAPIPSFLRRQEHPHPRTHTPPYPLPQFIPPPLPGGRLGGGWKAPSNLHSSRRPKNRHSRAPIPSFLRRQEHPHPRTPAPPLPPSPIHPSPLLGGRLGGGWNAPSHAPSPAHTPAPNRHSRAPTPSFPRR